MEVSLVDFQNLDCLDGSFEDDAYADETTALTVDMPQEQCNPGCNYLRRPSKVSATPLPSYIWDSRSSTTTPHTQIPGVPQSPTMPTPSRQGRTSCASMISNWKLLLNSEGSKESETIFRKLAKECCEDLFVDNEG
ncbi:hypothetical protein KUCAC02_012840 [Chaenocephalus aceratus]|uniref:Uncharacterized protein n=1 Tax=Chaenocephalus aceratus TaxID=36190 RepID=A0ACB9XDJ3_CHAAC|nr:hypothetical protein KUCAC02_012840 [Chaenocephalus aceratus]